MTDELQPTDWRQPQSTDSRPIWLPWCLKDWLFVAFVAYSCVAIGISVWIVNNA